MKKILTLLVLGTLLCLQLPAQQTPGAYVSQPTWYDVTQEPVREFRPIVPAEYRTVGIDIHAIRQYLFAAPHEKNVSATNSTYVIELPKPNGTMELFTLVEAPVMVPELQAQYPDIRSYAGQGITDPTATLRMDITQFGLHTMVLCQSGTWYIDPYSLQDDEVYISYTKEAFYANTSKVQNELPPIMPDKFDFDKFDEMHQDNNDTQKKGKQINVMGMLKTSSGGTLRSYRLALACTGEYSTFFGGTVANSMAAMTTSMTRINGIYEREVAVRMNMVANNSSLVYLNSATDPYSNNNGGAMLGQNQTTCDGVIGSANYDIGHVFSTGGGGVAYLQSVCNNSIKAGGVTGSSSPVGDPFDVDYVAHEMGHQFGGNHTQNNSCNRSAGAAYEPGSASTIMGYAGICPPDLQPHSDDYFHNKSYNEIISFSVTGGGNGCAAQSATGNSPPTVDAGVGGWTIPISTPFELTATGSDPNGDLITYNWEEFDLGPATAPGDLTLTNPSGNQPIFRSWLATVSPTRVFPRISDLVNNTIVLGEHMPTYDRGLTFKCTVRDNRAGGGGVADDIVSFSVDNIGGPFVVTAPNTAVVWTGGTAQTVTWNVANTTAAPISCANVDIFLSLDGGYTYPILVLGNTPNDGTQSITVPNNPTTQARIKVKAANNIFFDISNVNFTIVGGGPINGCTDPLANNYNPFATVNDGSCEYGCCSDPGYAYLSGPCAASVCALDSFCCTTSWDSICASEAAADPNCDYCDCSPIPGCTDPAANNYDVAATVDDGSCEYGCCSDPGYAYLSGPCATSVCALDSFCCTNTWDSICASEAAADPNCAYCYCAPIPGCTDPAANNYDPAATVDDGSCEYGCCEATGYVYLSGPCATSVCSYDSFCCAVSWDSICAAEAASDSNCDYCNCQIVPGCTDPAACNYNASATTDDGSCVAPLWYLPNTVGGGPAVLACSPPANYYLADQPCAVTVTTNDPFCVNNNWDGICMTAYNCCLGIYGCTDLAACNFDPNFPCTDNSLCTYPGCTDPAACNYNAAAGCDDGSCVFPLWYLPNTVNGGPAVYACSPPANYYLADQACAATVTSNDPFCVSTDWDGICQQAYNCCLGIYGCTDVSACNYDPNYPCSDNSLCTYPGCTDPAACNYDAAAGCDDGTCAYPGCTDNTACNYDPAAGCDDGSCDYSCNTCFGDFDHNGVINTADLLLLMAQFGCTSACGEYDLDGNGVVNTSDLLLFMAVFGTICP